ncbi:MAG: hypothetical protein MJ123_08420 [Lachnospiraceae bacterium]|nr:hypothetical protein [Lachnospiraceae bacterium]
MRKNEYESLEQFVSQYIGEWNPSGGHWYGLDFRYGGKIYRFHTGCMYDEKEILPNGKEVMFGLYEKKENDDDNKREYDLLGLFAEMKEVLSSKVIQGRPFCEVIVDENTELLGQD